MKEQFETVVPRRKFVAGDSTKPAKRLLGIAANRCVQPKETVTFKIN